MRVVVFIDYQNLYHRARDSFFEGDDPPPTIGHFSRASDDTDYLKSP